MVSNYANNDVAAQVLYYSNSKPITKNDIIAALRSAGLERGDIAMVHSDIGSFGRLGEVKDRDDFLGSIFNAFMTVLGIGGTLIVPSYTYSFCKNQNFDVKKTRSTVGVFTEFVRNRPDAVRSEDPIFPHVGIGKNANKLLLSLSDECFGEESFFDRLYKSGGKIINFGKFFDITFIHYIENAFKVSYRFNKNFSGLVVRADGSICPKTVTYYVRYLPEDGYDVHYNMASLARELEAKGLLKRVALGNSFILCSRVKDCYETGLEMLKKNEYAFLEYDPHTSSH